MGTQIAQKFSGFYEEWMSHLENILQHHINTRDGDYASIINNLTAHHKQFYQYKWELAHQDILSFINAPIWLTPLQNAHIWITGWKPSMAFCLVKKQQARGGFSDEQANKIETLRARIRVEEDNVERLMERVQVKMGDRETVEVLRLEEEQARQDGKKEAVEAAGEVVDGAMKGWLWGLEKVMKTGDCVRLKTLDGVLQILNPMQGLVFLASLAMFEIRVRKMGSERKHIIL